MLIYDIIVKCGAPGCSATQQLKATIVRPGPYALPHLDGWGSPFDKWRFDEDKPTLCPSHALDARKAAEAAEEEGDDR